MLAASQAFEESAAWATSFVQKAAEAIREEYLLTFEDYSCRLRAVRGNLVAMDFPSRGRSHWLATRLHRDFPQTHLIVNLSGRSYDTLEFHAPVMDIVMSGCVPPLDVILRLCVSSHRWLGRSKEHVIAVHGPDETARSSASGAGLGAVVVLFACYLSWTGQALHPKEGMLEVVEELDVTDEVWPSQRRYLSYFELLQRGLVQTAESSRVSLARLVLIDICTDGLRRAVEVWEQDRRIFRTETSELMTESENGAWAIRVGESCRGDISIRVLRAAQHVGEEPCTDVAPEWELELQVCLHTAFLVAVDNFARFPARELDAPLGGPLAESCAIDVFLEPLSQGEELRDPRELLAEHVAEVAAQEGPKAGPVFFNMAADDEIHEPESAEEADEEVVLMGEGARLGIAPGASRTVFAPEDIDAFFDEL